MDEHATPPRPARVAVVGAGIAGLACARALTAGGLEVAVVDKARGPGGRTSTRRAGDLAFDHGAQYFTARDPRFARQVVAWTRDGVVRAWDGEIVGLRGGEVTPGAGATRRFVGVPRMSAVTRQLAASSPPTFGVQVARIERARRGLTLVGTDGGRLGGFDAVVLAAPAPQTAALARPVAPAIAERAGAVPFAACWAVMLAFGSRLPLAFDGAFVEDSPLSWIARDSSKPGRPRGECWVLHGSPAWSDAHLDDDAAAVVAALGDAFAAAAQVELPGTVHARAHRWRHALPVEPLREPSLFDPASAVGACGDWCGGPRVEGAFLSGASLAERLLAWAADRRPRGRVRS